MYQGYASSVLMAASSPLMLPPLKTTGYVIFQVNQCKQ